MTLRESGAIGLLLFAVSAATITPAHSAPDCAGRDPRDCNPGTVPKGQDWKILFIGGHRQPNQWAAAEQDRKAPEAARKEREAAKAAAEKARRDQAAAAKEQERRETVQRERQERDIKARAEAEAKQRKTEEARQARLAAAAERAKADREKVDREKRCRGLGLPANCTEPNPGRTAKRH